MALPAGTAPRVSDGSMAAPPPTLPMPTSRKALESAVFEGHFGGSRSGSDSSGSDTEDRGSGMPDGFPAMTSSAPPEGAATGPFGGSPFSSGPGTGLSGPFGGASAVPGSSAPPSVPTMPALAPEEAFAGHAAALVAAHRASLEAIESALKLATASGMQDTVASLVHGLQEVSADSSTREESDVGSCRSGAGPAWARGLARCSRRASQLGYLACPAQSVARGSRARPLRPAHGAPGGHCSRLAPPAGRHALCSPLRWQLPGPASPPRSKLGQCSRLPSQSPWPSPGAIA